MSVVNDFILFICGDVVHAVWLSVPHSITGPCSDSVTTEELTTSSCYTQWSQCCSVSWWVSLNYPHADVWLGCVMFWGLLFIGQFHLYILIHPTYSVKISVKLYVDVCVLCMCACDIVFSQADLPGVEVTGCTILSLQPIYWLDWTEYVIAPADSLPASVHGRVSTRHCGHAVQLDCTNFLIISS